MTPLHRGEPGYSSSLDRDGDGIACEWGWGYAFRWRRSPGLTRHPGQVLLHIDSPDSSWSTTGRKRPALDQPVGHVLAHAEQVGHAERVEEVVSRHGSYI